LPDEILFHFHLRCALSVFVVFYVNYRPHFMRRASSGRRTYNSARGRLWQVILSVSLLHSDPLWLHWKHDQIETFYLQISLWIGLHSHLMQCLI